MNQRARLILSIVGAVLLCLAIYFLLVRSRQAELTTVRESVEAEEARTAQLQAELVRLRDLQKRAPELQAELDRFRALVPANHETANLIYLIDQAAKESGVEFAEIAPELPKSPPEGAPLAEVRMTIGSKGGYFALQDFIRRLYDLDRALRIDNLTMSGGEGATGQTVIDLRVTARVFFDLPAAPGAATAAPPNDAAPAPVETPAG